MPQGTSTVRITPVESTTIARHSGAHARQGAWTSAAGTVRGKMARYEIALQPEVSEVPRLLDWVERTGAAEEIALDIMFRVALALEEAVTNVIHHAFSEMPTPHLLRVRLEIGPECLRAAVHD